MSDRSRVLVVPGSDGRLLDPLEGAGYDLVTATGFDEALSTVERERPACLVTAEAVPGGTGLELLRAVREATPDLPMVLCPADGDERLAADAVTAGITEYVPRSDDPQALRDAVDRATPDGTVRTGERGARSIRGGSDDSETDALATFFDNIPDPAIEYAFDGETPIIRAANPSFEETFGFDADAVVGKPIDDVIVPDEKRDEAEALDRRAKAGKHIAAEITRETSEGTREFLLRTIAVEDGVQDVDGYAIYIDVTDQKQRERELRRQNERLDEFASVVSHDLRNPMEVIKNRIEVARLTEDLSHLDEALESIDRMDTLIRELLQMSRHGDRTNDRTAVNLESVVEDAWRHVSTGDATLSVRADVEIEADRGRLTQLFENLFINAVQHNESIAADADGGGGAEGVRPGADPTGADGTETGRDVSSITITVGFEGGCLYVADDGSGIPEPEREKIFESRYTTGDDGTGFGLTIVRQVAQAHGWDIGVTDSESGGARFEFRGVETVPGSGTEHS